MKTVIYGAGTICESVINGLDEKDIICIIDRDQKKWGGNICGYTVYGMDKLHHTDFERIVIAVSGKYEEIKKDLELFGIPECKIESYSDLCPVSPKNIGTMRCDWDKKLTESQIYDELCSHSDELSQMERFYLLGKHNRSFKWLHYFEIYNRHFNKYIGKDVVIMEIGVNRGGSLQIWKEVFGPKAKIIGVDITPDCKQFEDEQIQIFIGDQASREFWADVKSQIPKVDILIDDGGHYMDQQIITFEEMFPYVKDEGVYLCEDTATSYNPKKYNSGLKKDNTFIEYSKNFIDYIHAWLSNEENFKVNEYTRSMHSLHYYFGVLAIEKKPMYPPFDMEVCNNDEEQYAVVHFHGSI